MPEWAQRELFSTCSLAAPPVLVHPNGHTHTHTHTRELARRDELNLLRDSTWSRRRLSRCNRSDATVYRCWGNKQETGHGFIISYPDITKSILIILLITFPPSLLSCSPLLSFSEVRSQRPFSCPLLPTHEHARTLQLQMSRARPWRQPLLQSHQSRTNHGRELLGSNGPITAENCWVQTDQSRRCSWTLGSSFGLKVPARRTCCFFALVYFLDANTF